MTPFPGDALLPSPAVVLDRTAVFDVPASTLWPWVGSSARAVVAGMHRPGSNG
jgi:hypothetical protein